MLGQAQVFLTQIAGVIAQYQGLMAGAAAASSFMGGGLGGAYSGNLGMTNLGTYVGGLAEGGQFVATRPTTATFGEGGEPELVTITPLSQINAARSGIQPLNGANGLDGRNGQTQISVDLNLSPDLEARVVGRAMNETANVISKINRSKR